MTNNSVKDDIPDMAAFLRKGPQDDAAERRDVSTKAAPAPASQNTLEPVSRPPQRVAGGFSSVGEDLDRRARDWRNTVRLLEQQRPQLESAEAERDRLYEALGRVVPKVQETSRALAATIQTTKAGDVSGDLAAQFSKNLAALEELESAAEALTDNLLGLRASWEQYARTVIRAQKMRDELKG